VAFLTAAIIGNLAVSHIQGQDGLYIPIVYLFFIVIRYITIFLLDAILTGKESRTIPISNHS
jgi:hypothetical protein